MRQIITWLALGLALLLSGCRNQENGAHFPHATDQAISNSDFSYCHTINAFYNEDFLLSPEEDYRIFRDKSIRALFEENKVRGHTLCKALSSL